MSTKLDQAQLNVSRCCGPHAIGARRHARLTPIRLGTALAATRRHQGYRGSPSAGVGPRTDVDTRQTRWDGSRTQSLGRSRHQRSEGCPRCATDSRPGDGHERTTSAHQRWGAGEGPRSRRSWSACDRTIPGQCGHGAGRANGAPQVPEVPGSPGEDRVVPLDHLAVGAPWRVPEAPSDLSEHRGMGRSRRCGVDYPQGHSSRLIGQRGSGSRATSPYVCRLVASCKRTQAGREQSRAPVSWHHRLKPGQIVPWRLLISLEAQTSRIGARGRRP